MTREVKPYALMMGVPARQVGWWSAWGGAYRSPSGGERKLDLSAYQCGLPPTGWLTHLRGDNRFFQITDMIRQSSISFACRQEAHPDDRLSPHRKDSTSIIKFGYLCVAFAEHRFDDRLPWKCEWIADLSITHSSR